MSEPTVLIAGFSGRVLAASARRAGYRPLVVDAFGDDDTREIAQGNVRVLPQSFQRGFGFGSLQAALDELSGKAASAPIGLVLGAGFEDAPALVARLADRYTLLGCSPETITATKSPDRFFPLLADLGISHPDTRMVPPADGRGWLTKRIGGSGGLHIARCRARVSKLRDRYFQREVEGVAVSMLGIIGKSAAFAFTQSWLAPKPRRPFRFGGIVGSTDIDADLEARLIEIGLDLARALKLEGLVSFDFLVGDDGPLLLEVNPRPGVSLDVLDDSQGTLFAAHIAAVTGGDPAAILARNWAPRPRAAAYVYADDQGLSVPQVAWPDWIADCPSAGIRIRPHLPVCTVSAEGKTAKLAVALLDERLGIAKAMLYGREKKSGKEAPK